MGEIKGKTIKNAAIWSAIINIMRKLILPISNMVLARLLTPEVFGIVATINVVISFADIFTDAGFQKYLIQHEFSSDESLYKSTNVAFWTNIGLSLFIWFVFFLFRYPIARTVGSAGYETQLVIAALAIPMTSFSSIQQSLFKRRFDFKGMFVPNLISSLIPLVITVPLAFIRRDCWALILGTLAQRVSDAILFTVKSEWKPKLYYSVKRLKAMFSFSAWTLLEQLSIWLTINVDIFIIGRLLNSYYLGIYKTSITTVNQITSLITAIIIPVLFSALSRSQDNDIVFKRLFYEFQRKSAILLIPMSTGIFLYNKFITSVLLGSQWGEAALFIGLIGLMQAPSIMISNFASEVYRAKGEPKVSFIIQGLYILISIPIYIYGAKSGFDTLRYLKIILMLLFIIMHLSVLMVRYKFNIVKMFMNFVQPLIATLVMSVFAIIYSRSFNSVVYDILGISICIVIYFSVAVLLPDTRKLIKEIVKH